MFPCLFIRAQTGSDPVNLKICGTRSSETFSMAYKDMHACQML